MMLDLMIDLETLSTLPTAVVTQLGWALFDPRGDGVVRSGCLHLDVEAQLSRGLSMDWPTIEWWLKQSQSARDLMTTVIRKLPSEALLVFEDAVGFHLGAVDGVWSHGVGFDVVIMENLYRKAGRKVPWGYRAARDTRTLFWLAGKDLAWAPNEIKHSAEQDSIAQAITVQRAIRLIEGKPQCTSSTVETSTMPSSEEVASSDSTASNEIPAMAPSSSPPSP